MEWESVLNLFIRNLNPEELRKVPRKEEIRSISPAKAIHSKSKRLRDQRNLELCFLRGRSDNAYGLTFNCGAWPGLMSWRQNVVGTKDPAACCMLAVKRSTAGRNLGRKLCKYSCTKGGESLFLVKWATSFQSCVLLCCLLVSCLLGDKNRVKLLNGGVGFMALIPRKRSGSGPSRPGDQVNRERASVTSE